MIIGFVGFKQVGKSTAAKYLEKKYGAKRVNMKDGLVAELRKNFPDLLRYYQHLYGKLEVQSLFDEKPEPIRCLMVNYGTEVRRGDNPNWWVNTWKSAVDQVEGLIVVDDVRFLNEAEAVREKGGKIIRLVRSDVPTGGEHRSETEQLAIEVDHTISCVGGDEEHLYQELDLLMQ